MRQTYLSVVWLGVASAVLGAPRAEAADPVKVILLGGQSNMDGRASTSGLPTSPVNLQQPQSDVIYFNGYSGSNGYTGGALSTLRPGPTQFGPEVTLGRTLADANPSGSYALLKYAVGGTSLAVDWKAPMSGSPTTGSVYANFKTAIAAGLSALTASGRTYQIVGMMWLQGESDAVPQYSAAYQQNLTNFIGDVRNTYGAQLPFIIGGIGNDGDATNTAVVSNAQIAVASALANVRYFNDSDLWPSGSPLHFDAAGQQAIGGRFATALASVPEPASVAVIGVVAVGLMRRRRKSAAG